MDGWMDRWIMDAYHGSFTAEEIEIEQMMNHDMHG